MDQKTAMQDVLSWVDEHKEVMTTKRYTRSGPRIYYTKPLPMAPLASTPNRSSSDRSVSEPPRGPKRNAKGAVIKTGRHRRSTSLEARQPGRTTRSGQVGKLPPRKKSLKRKPQAAVRGIPKHIVPLATSAPLPLVKKPRPKRRPPARKKIPATLPVATTVSVPKTKHVQTKINLMQMSAAAKKKPVQVMKAMVRKDAVGGRLIKRAPFIRLLRGLLTAVVPVGCKPKISEKALDMIIEVTEAHIGNAMSECGQLKNHAGRVTLFTKDIDCRDRLIAPYENFKNIY